MQEFSLEKYYLDAVTEGGQHFVGYFGSLHYGPISICYADTMQSAGICGLKPGPSFDCSPRPACSTKSVTWRHPKLGFSGTWQALSPPFRRQLLSLDGGSVDWEVLQPRSKVLLDIEDGSTFEALGSCECLNLTTPPWQIGLKELTWGRFVSESNSVVWLEWKGDHPLRLMFWNGSEVKPEFISDRKVVSAELKIAISDERLIRSGSLGTEILSHVPKAMELAPVEFLRVQEIKKLGRGHFETRNGKTDKGWVIHEAVIWP